MGDGMIMGLMLLVPVVAAALTAAATLPHECPPEQAVLCVGRFYLMFAGLGFILRVLIAGAIALAAGGCL